MYCWKCGAEVAEGKRFCSDCGTMLEDNAPQKSVQQPLYQDGVQADKPIQPSESQQAPNPYTTQTQYGATQQPFVAVQQPYGTAQQSYPTAQVPYGNFPPQNYACNQPNPQAAKLEKSYKNSNWMSNLTMILGLVSLGMLVFGILFWPFYFLLYIVGIAALIVGFFAKRSSFDFKNIEAYKDKFKKNKSSIKLGKGLAIFSMVTPIVLITIVLSLIIYVASQLIGHTSEIITAIFTSGGIEGAFNRVVTLVSDLNDSGALLKILSILGVLIKLI